MRKDHLLDWLAERHNCYLSDLRLDPKLRRAALTDMRTLWGEIAPLDEWQVAVFYLTGCRRHFKSVEEVKRYLAELEVQDADI